jgi:hypothetical protein
MQRLIQPLSEEFIYGSAELPNQATFLVIGQRMPVDPQRSEQQQQKENNNVSEQQ